MTEQQSKFHCRHCKAEIGLTDGLCLMIAVIVGGEQLTIKFNHATKPHCPKCQCLTPWYPQRSQAENASKNNKLVVV